MKKSNCGKCRYWSPDGRWVRTECVYWQSIPDWAGYVGYKGTCCLFECGMNDYQRCASFKKVPWYQRLLTAGRKAHAEDSFLLQHEGGWAVEVKVLEEDEEYALILLPKSSIECGNVVKVKKELLVELTSCIQEG